MFNRLLHAATFLMAAGMAPHLAVAASPLGVSLAATANVFALFSDGSTATNGGVDLASNTFSATLAGTQVIWSGATFKLGAPGTANAVSGKTIPLPQGQYGSLKLLASGANGGYANQIFVVAYADGSTQTYYRGISDWLQPQSFPGEATALAMTYRLGPLGRPHGGPAYMYGYTLTLNTAKAVKSITLPANRGVLVLGANLMPVTTTVPASGNGTAAQVLLVNTGTVLGAITRNQVGSNLGAWYDITKGGVGESLKSAGARLIRWPGGSNSDAFLWKTQGYCGAAYMSPNSTFDNFMQHVVTPNGLEAAITVNYGSNSTCTGGGNPAAAAAWVAYSKSKGYNVHHWTVGNEVYGGWEYDLHTKPHDAATYATAVSGSNGYYDLMKSADSTAQLGVVVEPLWSGWDSTVLASGKFDFVELHWYAQQAGHESDSYLLTQSMTELKSELIALRSELASVGKPNTPIMLGEFNSVNMNPGKQTVSVVNALFLGMTYGELLNNNVAMAAAWSGYGGNCTNTGNNSSALYGWQNYGGYDQVSAGTYYWQNCGGSTTIPAGTVLPNGNAQSLVSKFATPGGKMLGVSYGAALVDVRAYAASDGSGGYSVMMFNVSPTASTPVTIMLGGLTGAAFNGTAITYGKAQYDDSKNAVWTGPVTSLLGTMNGSITVTLPPYSMTVLELN